MTGYLTWRLLNWSPVWQAQIFWTFFSQAAITSSWYFLFSLTGLQEKEALLSQLPFHLLSGVLYSFIILLWYRNQQYQRKLALLSREPLHTDIPTKEDTPQKQENLIQHISIKNGTRIHVIPIEEIHYIEACGDYVTLFTSSGQYVKEQTMKYFETHLPAQLFIRIHRSYILHIQQILRIEQFGKESYQIKLKNGNVLRASSNGYKLLKHRLKL
ncbi:MAG: LytTR family transcriptional regulator [Bacteroides sp.]|nr:LytTR family transcriptional regulator [Bacteroides sp.]